MLRINGDFTQRVAMHAAQMDWIASPMSGVERKMLDRMGGEVARATSLVRYAPGSSFAAHTHDGGEEFLVLEGVFQDEIGDYPAGTYVRNPPTSRHRPGSKPGCTIFVKLHQFDPEDRTQVRIDTNQTPPAAPAGGIRAAVIRLYRDSREDVRVEHWGAGSSVSLDVSDGLEVLVLEGSFEEGGETLVRHSWLRLPPGSILRAAAGITGARVWVKTGHLRDIRLPVG